MEELRQIAASTLNIMKAEGADQAKCIATLSEKQEFNVDGGEFSLYRTLFDKSLTITIIKDKKKGTMKINSFAQEDIRKAVKDCLAMAASSEADSAWSFAPGQGEHSYEHDVLEPDMDRYFDRIRELVTDIKTKHPLIMIELMVADYHQDKTVYMDTNDTCHCEKSGAYSFWATINSTQGDKVSSMSGIELTTNTLEKPFIQMGSVERDLSNTEKQLNPVPMEGKFTGTMVLTPDAVTQFVYFLIQNYAADDVMLAGNSQWKEKLGQKVTDEKLTLGMNPLDQRIVEGQRFTADGYVSANYNLIEKGVLKSFLLDQYAANRTGNKPSANTAENMIIEGGDKSLEEIISGIKDGILFGSFSGGYPEVSGEMSGVAKNSFLIKDGKITTAVTEAMINGNLGEMFQNITGISKETVCNGSMITPYIAMEGIVISGK